MSRSKKKDKSIISRGLLLSVNHEDQQKTEYRDEDECIILTICVVVLQYVVCLILHHSASTFLMEVLHISVHDADFVLHVKQWS